MHNEIIPTGACRTCLKARGFVVPAWGVINPSQVILVTASANSKCYVGTVAQTAGVCRDSRQPDEERYSEKRSHRRRRHDLRSFPVG